MRKSVVQIFGCYASTDRQCLIAKTGAAKRNHQEKKEYRRDLTYIQHSPAAG